ncbi:MAG: TraR/DksA C4-type zinc finger protein [Acidimicrobiia bacterium]|nr:TraR/DksA C4-type zinc finger protein [Acidimicrobiia bacterium]
MGRQLSAGTLERLRLRLEEERESLTRLLAEHEHEREEARLAETASERSPDPMTAEGGSMAFEYEKELSIDQNSLDLLVKVEHALERLEKGAYGDCEACGKSIPIARLEALPYTTLCVDCARTRR